MNEYILDDKYQINSNLNSEIRSSKSEISMRFLGIIPSRYASTRFPGKPLVDIAGKTMIQRVYEQAKKASSLDEVLVATDDERILLHVKDFGGRALLTSRKHQSGTDRCAEVADKISGYDVVINIQGDEPFIDPQQINLLCRCFVESQTSIATLVKKIETNEELLNANVPKVILNRSSQAIYFSRSPLPYFRGKDPSTWLEERTYYKHIGIYGYHAETLKLISQLPVSSLEEAECLEQLRWIENGYPISVSVTDRENTAIDTPEDLERLLQSRKDI